LLLDEHLLNPVFKTFETAMFFPVSHRQIRDPGKLAGL
jgi:hypothetical protein